MYKILIASLAGCYPETDIDTGLEVSNFMNSEKATCFVSLDPADLEKCDGVVIPGAPPDVNPAFWNEENIACGSIDEEYDQQQMTMIKRAFALHKPVFGICRGHQLVSVYLGGSLIQDIEHGDTHRFEEGIPKFHEITNIPGTFMFDLYGKSVTGNSLHHQALKKIPACLRVAQIWCPDSQKTEYYIKMAKTDELHEGNADCIIEAVSHKAYPFIGVQWHPELSGEYYCDKIDLTKLRNYFYSLIEGNRT